MNYSLKKILSFTAITVCMTILLLLLVEVILSAVWYHRSKNDFAILHYSEKISHALQQTKKSVWCPESPSYKKDDDLGYRFLPGKHHRKIKVESYFGLKKDIWEFTIDNDDNGHRKTSLTQSKDFDKPEIWIYGCSYTFGIPLNNEDTFPYLVQEQTPNFKVRNFACPAYGNIHALIDFKNRLKNTQNHELPVIVAVVYNRFHLERNVASPSWLNLVNSRLVGLNYPRAILEPNGNLNVEYIQLGKNWENSKSDAGTWIPWPPSSKEKKPVSFGENPSLEYMEDAAITIFDQINNLCEIHDIKCVIAFQSDDSFDRIYDYCQTQSCTPIDISLPYPLPNNLTCLPFDGHPNAKAHKIYSDKFLVGIKPLLK